MNTINIQLQVPNTGQYTLDEEQEAYVAESLNRALDQMEEHKKNGTKPMSARELLKQLEEEEG